MRWLLMAALMLAGCGYHIAGRADLFPKNIKTIDIEPFGNATVRANLARLVPAALAREFNSRTHYGIVAHAEQADAVLPGAIRRFDNGQTTAVPVSGLGPG